MPVIILDGIVGYFVQPFDWRVCCVTSIGENCPSSCCADEKVFVSMGTDGEMRNWQSDEIIEIMG